MRLLKTESIRWLDHECVHKLKMPVDQLIENAAAASCEWLTRHFSKTSKIAFLVGPGNNGKDALAVHRMLKKQSYSELQVFEKNRYQEFLEDSTRWDLIVDGLFGIGLNKKLEGVFSELVQKINAHQSFICSLDIPSGLDADLGIIHGEAVQADVTITFGFAKPGLFLKQGPSHRGQLLVADIGYPESLLKKDLFKFHLVTHKQVKRWLPSRDIQTNKAKAGRAVLFAGSEGMWGAGILAAKACSRVGAGYTHIVSEQKFPIEKAPEFLTSSKAQFKDLKASAIAIGPGLKVDSKVLSTINELADDFHGSVLVDASALTALAGKPNDLPSHWVLTPHAGELSRLIGLAATEIEKDPFAALSIACSKYKCWILLKGFHSILSNGEMFYIINSGNPSLAKAGSGDVLTGMILGFLAQGLNTAKAVLLAAYLHGWIADRWMMTRDELSLMPSDILDVLPQALKAFRK